MQAYWKMEQAVAPGLQYSQAYYESALAGVLAPGARWLDVGCGHQVLPPWRLEEERELVSRSGLAVGVDPDVASLRNHSTLPLLSGATVSHLPFADESFDLVTANMVVEHLARPEDQFREIRRVLRAGGVFMFHTPNARSYTTRLARMIPEGVKKALVSLLEDRRAEDLFPTHYRANTNERVRELADTAGFEFVSLHGIVSTAEFAVVLPVALVELLWIRQLMKPRFEGLRQTLLVQVRKPASLHVSPVLES
jgi:ubiquinone/menaquinone biosynthesis C-methylase UbiE